MNPRVYVACLACYNGGKLHGEWFDCDATLEESVKEQFEINEEGFAPCGGEERLIHDSEGFGAFNIGEVGVSEAQTIGEFLAKHGEKGAIALSHYNGNIEDATVACEESYMGEYESLEDYAIESCGYSEKQLESMLGGLSNYIDWERYAEDLETNGGIWSLTDSYGKFHVFIEN